MSNYSEYMIFGRSCYAVGVLRATLSLRCYSHHADACPSHA